MKTNKEKKLKDAGWKIGSTNEFLGLTPEESAYIEMKLALCNSLKEKRIKRRISQVAFAKKIASSQSRVAKMEAGDPSVSIDLIMKSLLTLGISKKELAQVISTSK